MRKTTISKKPHQKTTFVVFLTGEENHNVVFWMEQENHIVVIRTFVIFATISFAKRFNQTFTFNFTELSTVGSTFR